jgi:hypothetical protein
MDTREMLVEIEVGCAGLFHLVAVTKNGHFVGEELNAYGAPWLQLLV